MSMGEPREARAPKDATKPDGHKTSDEKGERIPKDKREAAIDISEASEKKPMV